MRPHKNRVLSDYFFPPEQIKGTWLRNAMLLLVLVAAVVFSGCAAMKNSGQRDNEASGKDIASLTCTGCHTEQCTAWMESRHADPARMSNVTDPKLRQCEACHEQSLAHGENPGKVTHPSIHDMSKSEQNAICGKCHYNKNVTGGKTVNPHNRHGLFMSVGLEGYTQQVSCLDCHRGHGKKADMLRTVRAHSCFGCHKEAVITMGVFQPVNYLTAGKTCVGCHPAHGGSRPKQIARMTVGAAVTCIVCHPTGNLGKVGF